MVSTNRPLRTGGGTDLAFAVMVLAAYFTTFSTIRSISVSVLVAIIVLGIAYITIGIYGYAYILHHESFRLRIGYFVAQIALGIAIIFLSGGVGYSAMILLPLAGHSVMLLPEFWRYAVNGAIISFYAVISRLVAGSWDAVYSSLPVFVAGQVFILVFTQMAVSEEQARIRIEGLVEELETANRQLRDYAMQAEDLATVKERNRLAREIHDGLGHHLTALNMQIKAARAVQEIDRLKAAELLANAETLTQKALMDVRQSVSALREPVAAGHTLAEQLRGALAPLDSSGIVTRYEQQGEIQNISPEVALAILRATQECVNNAIKHSKAAAVSVELDFREPGQLHYLFCDDGVGSDDLEGGFGLLGMKERIDLLDGELEIHSSKGKGFQVEIHLPI